MKRNISITLLMGLTLLGCGQSKQKAATTPADQKTVQLAEMIAQTPEGIALTDDQKIIMKEGLPEINTLKRLREYKLRSYLENRSLFKANEKSLLKALDEGLGTKSTVADALANHTEMYNFTGNYKVLVIPVQFADVNFVNKAFFEQLPGGGSPAQEYLFGEGKDSMTQFFRHSSFGKFHLTGEVTPIVTVDKPLVAYGEAVPGNSDINARGLVVDVLNKLKQTKTDKEWWSEYDNWDLSDYDGDGNFHEPDGFIDAVVIINAGKDQASCQRSFDPKSERPASQDVPEGPRKVAAVECFNRIWPHRWSISLSKDDPSYSSQGPIVEGRQRPAMNGLKITDELYAFDYNMQSEFSDRSTFIHEFSHSLSLPDVYSSGKDNSTGSWELMSQNANLQPQELSTYSKVALGWLSPKIVAQGEKTSAYLGAYNFVSERQRAEGSRYQGPITNDQGLSIVSQVPEYGEDVYRSVIVLTDPSSEQKQVVELKPENGQYVAYSGRFDGASRSVILNVNVPQEGEAKLSFQTLYHIETETSFESNSPEIKVITDFDIGHVVIGDKVVEDLRTVSGDANADTLAEMNPDCEADRVLELRLKRIQTGSLNDEEKEEFKKKAVLCRNPYWVEKNYDLSEYKGKKVQVEVRLTTDPGYTELGIVVDNVKMNGQVIEDFESSASIDGGFKKLKDGAEVLHFNQFYLMEYRNPGESFMQDKKEISYNMDNNIKEGNQSMFLKEGKDLGERFRMIDFKYQPGVLVWYFNSRYSQNENESATQDGQGYLLVLNSEVKEVPLPGIMSESTWFNEHGFYKDEEKDEDFKQFFKAQRDMFICFSHVQYATYITGERPKCDGGFEDFLQGLSFQGKGLRYRRELFNEQLPAARYQTFAVGEPYRNSAGFRTGLSTFRPKSFGEFNPFKVYKIEGQELVLDQALTDASFKSKPVDTYQDSDNKWSEHERFKGDTAVVNKVGFGFKVVEPAARITKLYSASVSPDENDFVHRRPKVKIYFDWQ